MKTKLLVLLLAVAGAAQAQSVVAPGAKLEKLADGFMFTEGPTCDAQGNLFFTDQPNDSILKWSVDGKLSTFLKPAGRANGMYFDTNGNLIVCAEAKNSLWSIAPDLTITPLVTEFQGRWFNGPNDMWIAPDGAIYFTDPFYLRLWTDRKATRIRGEKVWRLSPDRHDLRVVTGDLKKPNGITGTPDGRQLYIADIRANKTWRYNILPDGSLTNKTLFCTKGSDGMTIDEEGNLYLCATGQTNGVSVFNPAGQLMEHINVPEPWTANVCIGGTNHQTLFITASDSLYAIKLRVKGANAAK